MEGLTEGRVVHFVLPDGPHKGEHRPAFVVKVWDRATGYVNLQVFMDGTNDGPEYASGISWQTSVLYDEAQRPRTWHWIEKA
jgi:hypothetical protein